MKETDAHAALTKLVARAGSQRAAAKELGISEPYLFDLLRGQRNFSANMLDKLGLRRIVVTK